MSETRGARMIFAGLSVIVRPGMNLLMGKKWERFETLPTGGFIACPNHVTEIDPLVIGHVLYNHGHLPRYMAKGSLFQVPGLGAILRASRQIPVERSSAGASRSLELARELIAEGGAVVVYPEGTLTRDPDQWPMRGRTGAARLALQTGAPVVPIAHWGAQEVFPRYGKGFKIFPRKTVRVRACDPVDLSDLADKPMTRTVLDEATARIMASLTAGVAELRGETPPLAPWDPAEHGQPLTGRDVERGSGPGDRR